MDEKSITPSKGLASYTHLLILLIILFFIFLLPVKFTVPAMLPNAGVFPLSVSEWIFEPWNTSLFPLLSTLILIVYLFSLIFRRKCLSSYNTLYIPMLWTFLAGFSLLGFINASCLDFPILECTYIFGLASFAMLVYILISDNYDITNLIINVMIISVLILCFYGLYQYFIGFSDTKAYVEGILKSGVALIPDNMLQRLNDKQIFSTFAISNNFAGYLILMMPLTVFAISYSPYNGSKYVKIILVSLLSIVMILTLTLSGSRSAILSLVIAILIIAILILKLRKSFIVFLSLFSVIIISSVFLFLAKGWPSIIVRFDYFKTSLILLKNHLFAGSGWGSFFHSYPYMKQYMTGEAPNDPHNFVLSIGSQSGFISMLLLLAIFLIPALQAFKKLNISSYKEKLRSIELPILIGYTAWIIHSLTDTNFQIPGSVSIAIIFSAILFKNHPKNESVKSAFPKIFILLMVVLSIISIIGMGWNRFLGEYYLAKLNNAVFPNPLIQTTAENKDSVQLEYLLSKTIEYMPYSPFPLAAAAQFELKNNNLPKAENYMKDALLLSPERASFYYDLSVILVKEGKKKEAFYCLKKAYMLFPYKYRDTYEQVRKYYVQ